MSYPLSNLAILIRSIKSSGFVPTGSRLRSSTKSSWIWSAADSLTVIFAFSLFEMARWSRHADILFVGGNCTWSDDLYRFDGFFDGFRGIVRLVCNINDQNGRQLVSTKDANLEERAFTTLSENNRSDISRERERAIWENVCQWLTRDDFLQCSYVRETYINIYQHCHVRYLEAYTFFVHDTFPYTIFIYNDQWSRWELEISAM